jgi:ketosteroid isomerase-like protein
MPFEENMRKLSALFILSLVLLTMSCSKKFTPEEMLAAAKEIDQKSAAAANNKDIATYMTFRWNSPDYTVLDLTNFVKGFETFKKAYMDWVATLKECKFEFTETQNTVSGDIVIGQHKWKAENVGPDGVRKHQTGLYSDVKAFRDGKWVVVSETYVKLTDTADKQP